MRYTPSGFPMALDPIKLIVQAVNQTAPTFQAIGSSIKQLESELSTFKQQFEQVQQAARKIGEAADDGLLGLAEQLNKSYNQTKKFTESLGLSADVTGKAISLIKQLKAARADEATILGTLQQKLGVTAEQYDKLKAVAEPKGIGSLLSRAGLGGLVEGFGKLGLAIQGVQSIVNAVMSAGSQMFSLFIGQNEELNQQLLNASAGLVAGNRVFSNGVQMLDPTSSIQALQGPMRTALKQVQKDAIDLVGVTSNDLTGAFEVLVSKSAILANQSKEFADPIKAAGKLTIDFAAALGTMGLGMAQSRQEITAILTGNIDNNATVAKTLNITREQVQEWRAQGVLVDKLREKLAPYTQANALAAQSISGVSSNIRDVLEIVTREAGEPLLKPVVQVLQTIYQFLSTNQTKIQGYLSEVVGFIVTLGQAGASVFQSIQPALSAFQAAFEALLGGGLSGIKGLVDGVAQAFVGLGQAVAPVLQTLGELSVAIAAIMGVLLEGGGDIIGSLIGSLGALLSAIGPVLQPLADLATFLADFIQAVSSDPLGQILIQAIALTAALQVLGPMLLANLIAPLAGFITTTIPAFVGGITAAVIPAIQGMAVSLSGGVIPALQAAIPALQAFGASAWAALAPLLPILGPLIAIGGAIAVTLTVKRIGDMKNAQEELEGYEETSTRLQEEAIRTQQQLKALNDIEVKGGELTDEQIKKREVLNANARDLAAQIRSTNEEIGALNVDETQKGWQSNMLGFNEKMAEQLEGSVEVQANLLRNKGNLYKQLATDVENAQRNITEGAGGDPELFEQSSKDLLSLTNQQMELGAISREEAESRLRSLIEDGRVSAEVQQQAQQALTKLLQEGVKERQSILQGELDAGKLSQTQYNQQVLDATIAGLDAELAEIQRQRQLIGDTDEDALKTLEAKEAEIRSRRRQAQTQFLQDQVSEIQETNKQQQSLLEAQLAQGEVSREQYNQRTLDLTLTGLEDELAAIAAQKSQIENTESEAYKSLEAQEAEVLKRRQDALGKFLQDQLKAIQDGAQQQKDALSGALATGDLDQRDFNQQVLNIDVEAIDAQLAQVQQRLQEVGETNPKLQQELLAQEGKLYDQRANALKQFLDSQIQDITTDANERQSILEGQLVQGLVSEQNYYQKRRDLQLKSIDDQLAEIQRQKQRVGANNKEAQEALAAQEAELYGQRLDVLTQFQDEQLRLMEQQQQEAIDLLQIAEAERQAELQALINQGLVTEAEANQERLNNQKQQIEAELQLERDKLAYLESLPPYSDPRKEEEQQAKIRQSRIATAQATAQLLENERAQQEAAVRVLEEQLNRLVSRIQNKNAAYQQQLERQQRMSDAISTAMEYQNQLLEARKSLQDAISGAVLSDLGILQEMAKSGREKRELAQLEAEIKLRTLRTQQEMELQSLENQRMMNELAIERERIALRMKAAETRGQIAQAEADLAVLQRTPGATPEQVQAAQIGLQGLYDQMGFIGVENDLLDQRAEMERRSFDMQEMGMRERQRSERTQARFEYGQTLPAGEQRRYLRDLRDEIYGRYGAEAGDTDDLRGGVNRYLNRRERQADNLANLPDFNPTLPTLTPQMNLPIPDALPQTLDESRLMGEMLTSVQAISQFLQSMDGLVNVNQNNQIINQVQPGDVSNGNFQRQLEQQILNTQYTIAQKLQSKGNR
jgi:hypothetical protein